MDKEKEVFEKLFTILQRIQNLSENSHVDYIQLGKLSADMDSLALRLSKYFDITKDNE